MSSSFTRLVIVAFSSPSCSFVSIPTSARGNFGGPLVHKTTNYAPTPKQARAKKSFTCTGRIRGNYY